MAKLYVCAVWDSAMGAYAPPMFVPKIAVAQRSFTDEVNRPDERNQLYKHPDDYDLHCLGTFDDENGVFSDEDKQRISRAKDLIQKPD